MIGGYATLYGVTSRYFMHAPNYLEFRRGVFTRSLNAARDKTADIALLVDHNWEHILAGTIDDSLVLQDTSRGLKWWVDEDTRRGRIAADWIRAHPQYRSNSLGFRDGSGPQRTEYDGCIHATFTRATLREVSITWWGAIPGTDFEV